MSRRVALIDRDGTLNVDRHYLREPAELELLPGAVEGLTALRDAGWGLVVITNQSGIARGYLSVADLAALHERLAGLLAEVGLALDGIYACPHLESAGCPCRKPRTGLVDWAARELHFDPARSVVVGDKGLDIALGKNLGAATVLVRTGYGRQTEAAGLNAVRPDAVVDHLGDAARWIVAQLGRGD